MSLWHAIIYGIVEGLTEFLPISSTGHLILTARLLNQAHSDFLSSFQIVIQSGAILAVVCIYWKTLLCNFEVWKKLITAFIPTALIGFVLYKVIKNVFLGSSMVVVWSLFIGGLVLVIFEKTYREEKNSIEDIKAITYKQALTIGLFQSLAVVPGVSRSAATILGGLMLGLKRKTIVEFSFLLAVPTMFAATSFDLIKQGVSFSSDQVSFLLLGLFVSFLVAIMSIKFLLFYVKRYSFSGFGVYRMIIAMVFLFVKG